MTVSADAGVFPADALLRVSAVYGSAADLLGEEIAEKLKETWVLDISITGEDGAEYQPDTAKGEVSISFASSEIAEAAGANGSEVTVYHAESADAPLTELSADISEAASEGEVSVSADHFSIYIIAVTQQSTGQPGEKPAGDAAPEVHDYTITTRSKNYYTGDTVAFKLTATVPADAPAGTEYWFYSGGEKATAENIRNLSGSTKLTPDAAGQIVQEFTLPVNNAEQTDTISASLTGFTIEIDPQKSHFSDLSMSFTQQQEVTETDPDAAFFAQRPMASKKFSKQWADNGTANDAKIKAGSAMELALEAKIPAGDWVTLDDAAPDSLARFGYTRAPLMSEGTEDKNNTSTWGYEFRDKLNQYAPDGSEIEYRLTETATPAGYVAVHDDGSVLWNVRTEGYEATIRWMDNGGKYGSRPSVTDVAGLISSSQIKLGFEKDLSSGLFAGGIELTATDAAAPGCLKITEGADNTWVLTMPNLPKYDKDNTELGPYLTIDPAVPAGADVVPGTKYADEGKYENVLNHAQVTDGKLFTGGTVSETLSAETRYTNEKLWMDADGKNVTTRPDAFMTLWRYADDAANGGNNYNYAKGSPVPGQGVENVGINSPGIRDNSLSRVSVEIPSDTYEALQAYSTDGIKYFYLGKEKLSGGVFKNAGDSYVTMYRDKTADGWSELKKAENGYVPDGAQVCNILTGSKDMTVTKVWNAADRQDVNAKVKLSLDQRDAGGSLIEEGFKTAVLEGFGAEIKEKSAEFTGLPAYDKDGNAYNYSNPTESALYTDVDKDGTFAENEKAKVFKGDSPEVNYFLTADGYRYRQTFDAAVKGNTRITNTLVGNAEIVITKTFAGGMKPGEHSAALTYEIRQNGKAVGTVTRIYQDTDSGGTDAFGSTYVKSDGTTEPFTIGAYERFTTRTNPADAGLLPRYDGNGAQYVYTAGETESAGYTHKETVTFDESQKYGHDDANNRYYKDEHYLKTKISSVNMHIEQGPEISVYKKWIDAEETLYRQDVQVALEVQLEAGAPWKRIASDTITPSGRYQYISITAAGFNSAFPAQTSAGHDKYIDSAADGTAGDAEQVIVKTLYDKWIAAGKPTAATASAPAFRVAETAVGTDPVYEDGAAGLVWSKYPEHEKGCGFVSTKQQNYDVSYDNDGYSAAGMDFTFAVINKRVGTEHITLNKQWNDGGNVKKIRPDAVKITVQSSHAVWGNTVNAATGERMNGDGTITQNAATENVRSYLLRPGEPGVTVSPDGNTWTITTEELRKYDRDGAVISYIVTGEELIYDHDPQYTGADKAKDKEYGGQYARALSHGTYTIGDHHTHDEDSYTWTNTLIDTVYPVMYKYWRDLGYDAVGKNRPDIRSVLYRSYYDPGKASAGANPDGTPKDNVYEKVPENINHDWTKNIAGSSSQDWWQDRFAGVPRYINNYEVTYYIGEEWAAANLNDYVEVGAFEGAPETTGGKIAPYDYGTSKHPESRITVNGQQIWAARYDSAAGSGGVIVNRPEAVRDVIGTKIWPTDAVSSEMKDSGGKFPDVELELYRVEGKDRAAYEAAVADPNASQADKEQYLERVTEHQVIEGGISRTYPWKQKSDGTPETGEALTTASVQGGAGGTAQTAVADLKGGAVSFQFLHVAKYDPDGGAYLYLVKEKLKDPDAAGANVVITFTLSNDDLGGSLKAANIYNYDQNYTVSFSKEWIAKYTALDTNPSAILTLVRYLQQKNPDGTLGIIEGSRHPVRPKTALPEGAVITGPAETGFTTTPGSDGSVLISVDKSKFSGGTQKITEQIQWSELAYYAPNGFPFVYKIEETTGNKTRDTLASVEVSSKGHTETETTQSGSKLVTVTVDPVDAGDPYVEGDNLKSSHGEAASDLTNQYGDVLGGIKIIKTWAGTQSMMSLTARTH